MRNRAVGRAARKAATMAAASLAPKTISIDAGKSGNGGAASTSASGVAASEHLNNHKKDYTREREKINAQ